MTRRDLFGGWYMGWIERWPYLKALIVYVLLGVPVVLIGFETVEIGFRDFGGWGSQVKAGHSIVAVTWFCFTLNLIVRRYRDAGLPGWLVGAVIVSIAFAILQHFFLTADILGFIVDRVTVEGLIWSGAWVGVAALIAAVIPTDYFPWVVDRDRWAVFD